MNLALLLLTIYVVSLAITIFLICFFHPGSKTLRDQYKDRQTKLSSQEKAVFLFFVFGLAPLTCILVIVLVIDSNAYFSPHEIRCAKNLGDSNRSIFSQGKKIYVCFGHSGYKGEYYYKVIERIEKKYGNTKGHNLPNSIKNKYKRAVFLLANNNPHHFNNGVLIDRLLIARNYPLEKQKEKKWA